MCHVQQVARPANLRPFNSVDLHYICSNLREQDRAELFALLDHDSVYKLAWQVYGAVTNHGRGIISWANQRPAATGFFVQERPGVWQVGMFGTDDFRPAAMPLLKWFRLEAPDILSVCEGHRLHCDSLCGYDEAHKMIRAMGAIPEGPPMRKYGKAGEDFQRFVWIRGENDGVLQAGYVRKKTEEAADVRSKEGTGTGSTGSTTGQTRDDGAVGSARCQQGPRPDAGTRRRSN